MTTENEIRKQARRDFAAGVKAERAKLDDGMRHYVCDLCGQLWAADSSSRCPECDHDAIWEFKDSRAAWDHSAHILAGLQSGIFHKVRP